MLDFLSGGKASAERLAAPPIDALVPAHLETATFAVG